MSNFNPSFGTSDIIYENHLNVIKNLNFTAREIDIISCILHNRGEKKIASLLLISPRTISAHVYNIMNKIGCNSKDQIIDFIETSGKLAIIKEYYTHLVIKAHFEKLLLKIGSTVNRKIIRCFCDSSDDSEIEKKFYQSIERHLKLLNIEIDTDKNSHKAYDNIFVINNISMDNYYLDMIEAISNIINSDDLKKLIEEFNDIYNQIISSQNDHIIIVERKSKYANLIKIILFIIPIMLIITVFTYYYKFSNKDSNITIEQVNSKPDIILQLESFLEIIRSEGFNANNIDKEQSKNNQSMIKKVEHILDYQNILEVKKYFEKTEMDSRFLLDYVHSIHSLASYYMYNKHDGRKAREILLYCQNLIWHYLNSRSAVEIEFEHMTEDEIYSELNVIKDLPQIYTRIIYAIARTYIYQDGYQNATKYLKTSKYLGCKSGLFECYLSDVSGFLVVSKMDIEEKIKNGNRGVEIKDKLYQLIETYNNFINDERIYILDFIPNDSSQKTVIPTRNFYNIFDNQTRIIECYRDLLTISDSTDERKKIIQALSSILYNGFSSATQSNLDRNAKGIKYIINNIQSRKVASLYNVLGEIFLILHKQKENGAILYIPIFASNIIEDIQNKGSNDINLNIAYNFFDKSRSLSRNSDYTKADAYQGIIKVYEERLNSLNLSNEEASNLKKEIQEIKDKRSEINLNLGRS